MPRRSRLGDPCLAVAYVRASRDDARLGPEAQRAALDAWAQREGVRLVAVHGDLGVSGGAPLDARPGLVAALGELRAVGAGVLVVARRDRLARDVGVAMAIERAVAASGARVVSADGVGNGSEAADQLLRTILDAAAAYERALIRARTRAALAQRKARGLRAGEVPFGYRDGGGGRLEPEPQEQATLQALRAMRARGLTHRAIVAEAARLGLTSRAGTPLRRGHVARFLAT